MKAFEEWWNVTGGLEETEVILGTTCKVEELVDLLAESVWRAALEWVRDHGGAAGSDIYKSIEKELEVTEDEST